MSEIKNDDFYKRAVSEYSKFLFAIYKYLVGFLICFVSRMQWNQLCA